MLKPRTPRSLARRTLLRRASGLAVVAPALIRAQSTIPTAQYGAMAGDVIPGRAMIWSRANRASRMIVQWGTSENALTNRMVGPHCLDVSDFTGRMELSDLPAGQRIFYQVTFSDLASKNSVSEPVKGSFKTPPATKNADVTLVWGGDTAGQGYGINPEFGGMKIYDTMQASKADLFIHSGDNIYADGPIAASVRLPDGSTWRNLVTEEKSKVAETLNEYRGQYKYNLMDANMRKFNSEVAQVWQWDDHEVTNNFSDSKDLSADARYTEKSVPLLVARAKRAFLEYAPLRFAPEETERIYRKIPYGPLVDVFVIDMRTYRGPNTANLQQIESADTDFLGDTQVQWLLRGLRDSKAVWKVIAADMPIGLNVGDGTVNGQPKWEAIANGNGGTPLGRELETARLLKGIKDASIQNVVWITADVHYTAAHYYHPDLAQFKEFLPFWEFVGGPLNAGTFGPNATDPTFGIQVVYANTPPAGQANLPPSAGLQFFGEMKFQGPTGQLYVSLKDINGAVVFSRLLSPVA